MRRGGVLAGLGKGMRARQWPREDPLVREKLVEEGWWLLPAAKALAQLLP